MMRGIGWRNAVLAVLTATAVLAMHATAADRRDGLAAITDRQPTAAVSVTVTDLLPEPSEAALAQLQPPMEEPRAAAPPVAPEPPTPKEPRVDTRRPPPGPPMSDLLARFAARRRSPLATVPYMFGDFYGGGSGQVSVTIPPITRVVRDGEFDLFVANSGGFGANINPAVPIGITDGVAGALLIATSIGNGLDLSGDGQPDIYPISSPTVPGLLPPSVPCPGTLIYTSGNAVYADAQGNPQDGSVGQGNGWSVVADYVCNPSQFVVNVPQAGGTVRRVKIADNTSPEPRDRLFFNFNFFNDVIGGLGDVSQYTFGYERTFREGDWSVEIRVPFAATLASEQTACGAEARDLEFGNLAVWAKKVLYEVPGGLISAGLGVAVPTGPSSRVRVDQTPILEIENQAVHVLPYLAAMSEFRERWYWQSFLQLDIGTNGNPVRGDVMGQHLNQFGVLQEATLLFADAGVGYALYEAPETCGWTRVAPTAELHYSTTLQDTDIASGNGFVIRSPTRRFDVLNLTLGASLLWNDRLWVRPAMVIPLRDDDDEHFDYEAMMQVDWRL